MKLSKKILFSHCICLSLAVLVVYLLGYPKRIDRILLTYFSLIFLGRFTIFRFFFGLSFVIAALYFPIAYYYGPPNVAVISALFETDMDEVNEFCSQISTYLFLITFLLLTAFVLIFIKLPFPTVHNYYLIIFTLILLCYKPIKAYIKFIPTPSHSLSEEIMDNVKYPFFEFYKALLTSGKIYCSEKEAQLKQIEQQNTIPILSVNPDHKNYLIIIGESVRKDYMNAYGFSYDNTPFATQHANVIWDGLIAPASNTQASVPHLISQAIYSDDKIVNAQLNNNIVSIANDAGFETYWLSNQGKLGKIEITVPRIAAYANYNFYTKKGEYNGKSSHGKHDTLLLPELDKILSDKQAKPRLIVMHLMGSHSNFCRRLQFDIQFNLYNENISCYVSSIKETDDLIKSTIDILKKHNEDYSLVYFADHGLTHLDQYQDLRHNWEYQNSYEVPFIFFDSKSTTQQKIEKKISGYQLVYLLSKWMGITLEVSHEYMQNKLTDIPHQTKIKIKDWKNELYPYEKLKKDPNPFFIK